MLIALALGFALAAPAMAADPLEGLIGKKRVVLLFAKSRSDASLDEQVARLAERRPEIEANAMVVLRTAGDNETLPIIGYATLPGGAARALIRRFQPGPTGITVVYVARDGQEKGRWTQVVDPQAIFDLADSATVLQEENAAAGAVR